MCTGIEEIDEHDKAIKILNEFKAKELKEKMFVEQISKNLTIKSNKKERLEIYKNIKL